LLTCLIERGGSTGGVSEKEMNTITSIRAIGIKPKLETKKGIDKVTRALGGVTVKHEDICEPPLSSLRPKSYHYPKCSIVSNYSDTRN